MDELIKRLRAAAIMSDALSVFLPHSEGSAVSKMYNEAADAIEELQKAVNFHKFNSEFWEDKYNSLADERWIPVTERLPDMNVPCLVYNRSQPTMVGWRIDYKRFRILGSCFPGFPTHWMPLPEPPKEE